MKNDSIIYIHLHNLGVELKANWHISHNLKPQYPRFASLYNVSYISSSGLSHFLAYTCGHIQSYWNIFFCWDTFLSWKTITPYNSLIPPWQFCWLYAMAIHHQSSVSSVTNTTINGLICSIADKTILNGHIMNWKTIHLKIYVKFKVATSCSSYWNIYYQDAVCQTKS